MNIDLGNVTWEQIKNNVPANKFWYLIIDCDTKATKIWLKGYEFVAYTTVMQIWLPCIYEFHDFLINNYFIARDAFL